MATGGFHGGSSHSGGYHSSGGGGFGGGGRSSGGFGHYGFNGSAEEGLMMIGLIILAVTFYVLAHLQKGTIPGINLVSVSIYVITGFAFIISFKGHKRVKELERVRRKHVVRSYSGVRSEFKSPERRGTKETWVGKHDKNFSISFSEERFGDRNLMRVKEFMKTKPVTFLLWPKVFLIITILWFLLQTPVSVFVKDLLIPKPISVKEIDHIVNIVSYVQAGLALVFPILSAVFVKVREKLLYKCAANIVDEIEKELEPESKAQPETEAAQ